MNKKNPLLRRESISYILGVILVVIASWWKYFSTGNIAVGSQPVETWEVYPIFGLYVLGLGLNIWAYYRVVTLKIVLSSSAIFKIAGLTIVLAAFMLPILSTDVFIYLSLGDLWNQGMATYIHPEFNLKTRFLEYYPKGCLDCPNHYGPLLLYVFSAAVGLGHSIVGSLVVYKILVALVGIGFLLLARKFVNQHQSKPPSSINSFALVVLSPIFWIQGIGQAHVDGIIIFLLMGLIVYLFEERRLFLASVFAGCAISTKTIFAIVFIPFVITCIWWVNNKGLLALFKNKIIALFIIIFVVVLCYIPVWEGIQTLTSFMEFQKEKPPVRSHIVVLGDIIFYGKQFLFQADKVLDMIQNNDALQKQKMEMYKELTFIFQIIGALLAAWVLLGLFFIRSKREILHIFGKVFIVIFCVFSPIFHPWNLLITLPFFILTQKKSWGIYLIIIYSISNIYEIQFSIPKGTALYTFTTISMTLMIFSFYLYFIPHFIKETQLLIKQNRFRFPWYAMDLD